jgi:hypothetical protein
MRAQFIRGLDPKDAMNTGDILGRATKRLRKVLEKIAKERNVEIKYDSDPTYFSGTFEYKSYCKYYLGVDPDSEEEGIYVVGFELLDKPAGDETFFGTLKEAVEKLNSWLDWVDENVDEDGGLMSIMNESENTGWVDVEENFGGVTIKYKHQIAEDDYEVDETRYIDPYQMDMYLGLKLGLSIKDIHEEEITIDIKDIDKISDEEWEFITNHGIIKLTLGQLEMLAER